MAGSSLFALLDDIATMLDDISVMTKVAAKKTAGVLGDDLALNAQQVSGVRTERELPIVWAVAKGSFLNKLILVPSALLVSATLPELIGPLLMIGGFYLCYEGVEKIWHSLMHKEVIQQDKQALRNALKTPTDLAEFERVKIKGAVRTDFILSAEIIVIALGTVSNESIGTQATVISVIAFAMTIGVYGLVALIVKLDDIGLLLQQDQRKLPVGTFKRKLGEALLAFCPWLMKALSFFGTLAMFLVGGGIIAHEFEYLHHLLQAVNQLTGLPLVTGMIFNLITGLLAGSIVLSLQSSLKRLRS